MSPADKTELYERVSALRGATFDLIGQMTDDGVARAREDSSVIDRLQGVANRLGSVEQILDGPNGADSHAEPVPVVEKQDEGPRPSLSQDAAIVLGLASTAMPFATALEDEAERWLRIMRLHGHVGVALQGLGVSEAPLETRAEAREVRVRAQQKISKRDPVEMVRKRACSMAQRRGSRAVSTVDVLFAVLQVYGGTFDRTLYEHGTERDELLGRLVGARAERV